MKRNVRLWAVICRDTQTGYEFARHIEQYRTVATRKRDEMRAMGFRDRVYVLRPVNAAIPLAGKRAR